MLMPSIFGESLLDNFFRSPFEDYGFTSSSRDLMKTDIKDIDHSYEITMNLPGVKKEDVKAELKNGYLTIQASSNSEKEEKIITADISAGSVTAVHAAEAFM